VDVRLLGSGGWVPSDRRETASVYLREGTDVLVLDAGTGFRRLLTNPDLLEGVERVSVVLSHFHLDHTAGLVCAHALRDVTVREVWAPGRLIAGSSATDLVHRLLGPPFLAADSGDVLGEILTGVHELEGDVTIGPFAIETRLQPQHAGPTVAFKVNGELAYCTDTAYDEENAVFVRGTRVLLHEAFHASDETDDPIHSAAGEAARIAAEAGVDRLVLVHVHPLVTDDDELLGFAREQFPASEVGRDGPLA
jgi:ribonuclease BN (tRNA processing enzyme)